MFKETDKRVNFQFILPLLGVIVIILNALNVEVWAGVFSCFFIISLFYIYVYMVYRECGIKKTIERLTKRQIIIFGCTYAVLNLIIFSILLKNRTVYYWDFGGYWGVSITQSDNFFIDSYNTLKSVFISINNDEYNTLIPSMIALPLKIFGKDFPMYAIIVFNMFIGPTFVAIYIIISKIIENKKICTITMLGIMLCVAFYSPVILGYLDAFSLLNLTLTYAILQDDILDIFSLKKCVLLGISLVLAMMGRRYFAYGVCGIVVAVIVVSIIKIVIGKEKKRIFCVLGMSALAIASTMAIPLLIFFRKFLLNSFNNTIKVAYSAYQTGDVIHNYLELVRYYGVLPILIAVLGVVYWIRSKKKWDYCSICIIAIWISTYMFYKVQSMGNHHYYITIIPIVIFTAYAFEALKKTRVGYGALSIILALNMVIALFNCSVGTGWLFTNQKLLPTIRTDLPVLQKMTSDLQELSLEGNKIYLCASSTELNDDLIRKINMPDELVSVPSLSVSSHVDLRDGFPVDFLDSDIVLVASPIQYHLGEENQRVVGILGNELINRTGIGQKFELINTYSIESNIQVYMYRKTQDLSNNDLEDLAKTFDKYYSDYPELFRNRIIGAKIGE